MIILDTNVVSEVMKPQPNPSLIDWLNRQETASLHLTTITLAEIGYGLHVMPDGNRRRSLEGRFDKFMAEAFDQRILAFDVVSARLYGELMGHRKLLGRPMSILDGQIASIARAKRFAVATRNVEDFEECGVSLINPFEEAEAR
jgi:predicted nucleic acid-binding protein